MTLYKVVNIADKDPLIMSPIYRYIRAAVVVFVTLAMLLAGSCLCVALASQKATEKNPLLMSPVFEPFGVVPHVLYKFHTPQPPNALLKGPCAVFHPFEDFLPFTRRENEKLTYS